MPIILIYPYIALEKFPFYNDLVANLLVAEASISDIKCVQSSAFSGLSYLSDCDNFNTNSLTETIKESLTTSTPICHKSWSVLTILLS